MSTAIVASTSKDDYDGLVSCNGADGLAHNGVATIADEAYFDERALSNCWLAALYDFKSMNATMFKQQTNASELHLRQRSAPLWYGPMPKSSFTPSTTSSFVAQITSGATYSNRADYGARNGQYSQDRQQTKNNRKRSQGPKMVEANKRARQTSPIAWQPVSPPNQSRQIDLSKTSANLSRPIVDAIVSPTTATRQHDKFHSPEPAVQNDDEEDESDPELPDATSEPQLPSASSYHMRTSPSPPPLVDPSSSSPAIAADATARTPVPTRPTIRFPDPLDVADVDDADVPNLDEADEQELLNAALWAWFTAGYNTAMYNMARQRHE
ncbi:hypothetical protein OIO90_001895 [Microbotryomycetes sp. JL221]|nr:hypothetical protein OIO90_001895 [Microbotryomycetes sp. JL221]